MRREGTPAWMQVVERRREQAAEDARSRPAQAGIQETGPKRQMEPGLCLSAINLKVIPRVIIPA